MMDLNQAVGAALRELRVRNGASQEQVGSSQSYVSDVERGFKALSIDKLDEFSKNIGVHPLSVLAKAYLLKNQDVSLEDLTMQMRKDLGLV
jgi:transcriptional regulator with XRE-family HTH domain